MKINFEAQTIVITKKESKAKVNSNTFRELSQIRRDFPEYRIVVSESKGNKNPYKGLTSEVIMNYIKAHDDEEKSFMTKYEKKRAEEEALGGKFTYLKLRAWFLEEFKEVKAHYEA